MALNVLRKISCRRPLINTTYKFYGIYEPTYLEELRPKIPHYPTLLIKLTGYTYPVLESYQAFIHTKLVNILDIKLIKNYAVPHTELCVKRFKPMSSKTETEYILKIYERNMVISKVSMTNYPILLRLLEATLPEGVSFRIENYDVQIEETKRYIPNTNLLELKSQLAATYKKK